MPLKNPNASAIKYCFISVKKSLILVNNVLQKAAKKSNADTEVRLEIKRILEKEAKSAYQIGLQLVTSNDSIVIALQDMMEENIISLNEINQFHL